MNKVHEELRSVFEQREHDVSKDWEEKLQALHNDHQAAVKYLRGTEKMLAKMKQELDRYKSANTRLEEELELARNEAHTMKSEQIDEWEAERAMFRSELSATQQNMRATISGLEVQLANIQSELAGARHEAESAALSTRNAQSVADQTRLELESLQGQHALVEERAREAESRVQMFLDQFETSVDSYRRQSQLPTSGLNGEHARHRTHDSVASAESLYSHNDGSSTPDATARPASSATRNSMALDNLASELDALRSHWETTNKAYRLSDRFDFEKASTGDKNDGDMLSQWRNRVDLQDDIEGDLGKDDSNMVQMDSSKASPATTIGPKR
jgi:chromosome segregation ATPase